MQITSAPRSCSCALLALSAVAHATSTPSAVEYACSQRDFQPAVDHHAQRLTRRADLAHGQLRIVVAHCADPGQHRARARAPVMAVAARRRARNPLDSCRCSMPSCRRGSPRFSCASRAARASRANTKPILSSRASSSSTPIAVSIPAAFYASMPCPAVRGSGSCIAATTRSTPAAINASSQGGVRP